MGKLKIGFFNRIKHNLELKQDFKHYLEYDAVLNYYHITDDYSNFKDCYIAINEDINKIVAFMFVNKKNNTIYRIETRVKGFNLAMILINNYNTKYNVKLMPYDIADDIKPFWIKHGYTIDYKNNKSLL